MMDVTKTSFIKAFVIGIIFIFAAGSHAQNRFDGYSLTVSAGRHGRLSGAFSAAS